MNGIAWIGERSTPQTWGDVRHYELLDRFAFLTQIGLPGWKGITRVEAWLTRLISRRFTLLFCTKTSLIRSWRGPIIVDIDDPTFSESEVALLNSPAVQVLVTTTDQLRTEFITRGVHAPIEVVPSGFGTHALDQKRSEHLARMYNPQGHPVIGYHALSLELPAHSPAQGDISLLIDAMELVWLEMPHVQLWLIGDAKKEVHRWAGTRPQVRLFGFVPRAGLGGYIRNFTLGTYPRRLDHKGRFSIKLIEYLANGIPVVGTPVSETQIVVRANAGVLAQTPGEFADAVCRLLTHHGDRERLASNGRAFATPYNWDRIAADYQTRIFSPYLS